MASSSTDAGTDPHAAARLAERLAPIAQASRGPEIDARYRIADSLRAIIGRLSAVRASRPEWEGIADTLRDLGDTVASLSGADGALAPSDPGRPYLDWSPQLGMASALAPPIRPTIEGSAVIGRVRYSTAYEGPPGHVHGGHIAAGFDEILGLTQRLTGRSGMTGTLTVTYLRPTPLHRELRFEGRLDSMDGRKITTSGSLHVDDVVTATATAVFVTG